MKVKTLLLLLLLPLLLMTPALAATCPIPEGINRTIWNILPVGVVMLYIAGMVWFYKRTEIPFMEWVAELAGYIIIGALILGLGLNLFFSVGC